MAMKMTMESMEMAPGAIPCPDRVPEQRLLSPESCLRRRRSYGTFRGWWPIDLGFTRREASYRRKGKVGGGQGAHTTPRRGQGLGHT
jgi:hypothetical protein